MSIVNERARSLDTNNLFLLKIKGTKHYKVKTQLFDEKHAAVCKDTFKFCPPLSAEILSGFEASYSLTSTHATVPNPPMK